VTEAFVFVGDLESYLGRWVDNWWNRLVKRAERLYTLNTLPWEDTWRDEWHWLRLSQESAQAGQGFFTIDFFVEEEHGHAHNFTLYFDENGTEADHSHK